jgi:hypothetical protein
MPLSNRSAEHGLSRPMDQTRASSSQTREFLLRQFEPLLVSFIVHQVKEGGLMMGSTLNYVGYGLVPRRFWAQ